eukprot:1142355-Pelagomonas_calceolata.AAC.9
MEKGNSKKKERKFPQIKGACPQGQAPTPSSNAAAAAGSAPPAPAALGGSTATHHASMHACTAQAKCLPCSWASKVDSLASLPARRTVPFGHEKACTDQSTVAAAGSRSSHYLGLPACRGCGGLEAAQGAAVAAGEAGGPSNRQSVQAVRSCAPPMVDHHLSHLRPMVAYEQQQELEHLFYNLKLSNIMPHKDRTG